MSSEKIIVFALVVALSWHPVFAQDTLAIGIVDIYGARTVPESSIRKALGIEAGQSVAIDSATVEKLKNRMTAIPGIKRSAITFTCCEAKQGKWLIYAGVSEQANDEFSYNPKPTGSFRLPGEIVDNYKKLDSARGVAVMKNDAGEDDTQGHTLMDNAGARQFQEKYIEYADAGHALSILRMVLHSSSSEYQRAVAAEVIAYSKNKKEVLNDLLQAVHDPDEEVRNNVTRAIGVLAVYANLNPSVDLKISGTTFVQMLNSLAWTDRNKALFVLLPLTQDHDQIILQQLKRDALPSLIEMAKWESPNHAYSAYAILGRIAGFDDDKITENFYSASRNEYLKKIIQKIN